VSPDEPKVAAFIAAAERRTRTLAAIEASGWALCGAGIAAGAALMLHVRPGIAGALSVLAAIVTAVLWIADGWRRRTARSAIVAGIERAHPELRNLLVTAHELTLTQELRERRPSSPPLKVPPGVRARVFADTAKTIQTADLRSAIPSASAIRAAITGVGVSLIVAGGLAVTRTARAHAMITASSPISFHSRSAAVATGDLHVTATIQPPGYTRLPAQTVVDPVELHAVEGSALSLEIGSPGDRVVIEHDDGSRTLARGVDGRFADRLVLTKTGFLVVSSPGGAKRIVPLVIAPDALPVVQLTAPGRDLIYSGGNPRIVFEARATDDFGVRDLALRYTKVSGSGEQFEFKEGSIPLTIARGSDREWQGTAARALADLDLKEGDMLVYRAVASDARPGNGSASSDAFFVEISKLGAAAGDAFTLPEEETRYALSQQMLIVKTERLIKRQPSMLPAEVTETALNLAVEQRMIRAEFVFMLGGEVQDEEVEAQESTELQEGRQQNRGQQDVRAATQAMSIAGKYLTGTQLTSALGAERAAVTALQRAFSKDRYILRALATRSPLDLTRRLTGDLSQAADWRRRRSEAPANRRAALLQDLLEGIGAMSGAGAVPPIHATPATTTGMSDLARQQLLVLAEQALRIDPGSAALRQAAADLQRIADTWRASSAQSRTSALDGVSSRIAGEAQKALAAAPAQPRSAAPALRGAFVDALHAHGAAR
jgi:hypothetical protein